MITRKYVRDALRFALADETEGFNVQLERIATAYGVDSDKFVLDFTRGSPSFAFACVDPATAESFRGLKPPFCLIYTGPAQPNDEGPKAGDFAGNVAGYIVLVFRFRDSREVDPTTVSSHVELSDLESLLDAAEDAAMAAVSAMLPDGQTPFEGVWCDTRPSSNRVPCELYGDGYGAVVTLQYLFQLAV